MWLVIVFEFYSPDLIVTSLAGLYAQVPTEVYTQKMFDMSKHDYMTLVRKSSSSMLPCLTFF